MKWQEMATEIFQTLDKKASFIFFRIIPNDEIRCSEAIKKCFRDIGFQNRGFLSRIELANIMQAMSQDPHANISTYQEPFLKTFKHYFRIKLHASIFSHGCKNKVFLRTCGCRGAQAKTPASPAPLCSKYKSL